MADKKILWVFSRSYGNALVVALIVTAIVALIWSYIQSQSFSTDNAWVMIVEMALLAAVVGWAVGMLIGDARPSTLWMAAGFAILGTVLASGLMAAGAAGASIDDAFLGSLFAELFTTSVSVGYAVLAIVAAAFATWGAKFRL